MRRNTETQCRMPNERKCGQTGDRRQIASTHLRRNDSHREERSITMVTTCATDHQLAPTGANACRAPSLRRFIVIPSQGTSPCARTDVRCATDHPLLKAILTRRTHRACYKSGYHNAGTYRLIGLRRITTTTSSGASGSEEAEHAILPWTSLPHHRQRPQRQA